MNAQELKNYLAGAFDHLALWQADVIYLYSDFREFGTIAPEFPDKESFCRAFVDPFLKQEKTVVQTTFTYTTSGDFNTKTTRTNLGVLNKWAIAQPDVVRSEHPLFSYSALGPQSSALMRNVGKSAFGSNSVYTRLQGKKCAFVHIGRPVSMGNTALHFIEQSCGATYRVHKGFKTRVFRGEEYVGTDYTAFLRRRDVEGQAFEFSFTEAARLMFEKGLIREVKAKDELSNISFYWYDQCLDFLTDLFYSNQHIFIKSDFIQY